MIWIKLGIILSGFAYAGLLPYLVKKSIQHIGIDLGKQTLSFLSNKEIYGKKYLKGYKQLLFLTAILQYTFFWLLSNHYHLGEHELLMQYMDYSFAFITLLAFVPHNIQPYSLRRLGPSLQRILHNLLAAVVFLLIPALIIVFQVAILPEFRLLGISGLVVVGVVMAVTYVSVIFKGVNGLTELMFINGISIWSIYVTIMTLLFY